MSAVDAASSTAAATSNQNRTVGDLDNTEFLEIIFAELTNQDPLAPNETKDLLEQISLIRGIESDTSLADTLGALVNQNALAQAGGLIGKFVSGTNQFGDPAEDFVLSVTSTAEGPILNLLNGQRVPMDRIEEIIDPAAFGAVPSGSESGDGSDEEETTTP